MKIFNRYYSLYNLLLLLGDLAFLAVAAVVLRIVVHEMGLTAVLSWNRWFMQGGTLAVLVVLAFYYVDLYSIDQTLPQRELVLRMANGFGVACLLVGVVSYFVPSLGFKEIQLVELWFLGGVLYGWRLIYMLLLKKAKVHSRVLIVGIQKIGTLVAEELCRQKHLGLEVVGFIGSRRGQLTLSYGNPKRVTLPVFPFHGILNLIEQAEVNRILIAGAEACGEFPAQELVTLRLQGFPIEDCHTFYERLMSKISIIDLQPGWIALSQGFRRARWVLLAKRCIDIVVSAIGLVLSFPIAILTAVAIKLESRGPIFYRQERAGQKETSFTLYKFRSMLENAEAETGPVWAAEEDPRVTRVGRIIRKVRIDEIPQLYNVLRGEMSFVGPRPERPFFVSKLKENIPYYHMRFSVKPGITGWAQISYPYGDSEADAVEKLQYDLYYIKNTSPIFDLQIIFETLKIIIFGWGSR